MKKQFYILVKGEKIPVSEEVYRAYKRPIWAEKKRRQRDTADGVIPLSLDALMEDGFDAPDPADTAELAIQNLQLELLLAAFETLLPDEKSLIKALFYSDRTGRDYAAEIGISHQAVGKRKAKILAKLRKLMETDEE